MRTCIQRGQSPVVGCCWLSISLHLFCCPHSTFYILQPLHLPLQPLYGAGPGSGLVHDLPIFHEEVARQEERILAQRLRQIGLQLRAGQHVEAAEVEIIDGVQPFAAVAELVERDVQPLDAVGVQQAIGREPVQLAGI
jgi:hypothetical protein